MGNGLLLSDFRELTRSRKHSKGEGSVSLLVRAEQLLNSFARRGVSIFISRLGCGFPDRYIGIGYRFDDYLRACRCQMYILRGNNPVVLGQKNESDKIRNSHLDFLWG